jgi:hypothetical protein
VRLQFVFFRVCRTVWGKTASPWPNSTLLSASSRNQMCLLISIPTPGSVSARWPAGECGLQAVLDEALPDLRESDQTHAEGLVDLLLGPSTPLGARLGFEQGPGSEQLASGAAAALPLVTSCSNSRRSSEVKVRIYFWFITGFPLIRRTITSLMRGNPRQPFNTIRSKH